MTYSKTNYWLVWLSRIHHCRGFGIQSPTDYAFVRYVVNEHWPYYAYDELTDDDWLAQKLGRLYFRLANWRQPKVMLADRWQRYCQAGCRTTQFADSIDRVELASIDIDDNEGWQRLLTKTDESSVVVVDDIHRNRQRWLDMQHDEHTGVTFDLYYCGIVMFDRKRYRKHYIVNF